MVNIETFIQELRQDELGDMLYLEIAEYVLAEQCCESVDDYIQRVIETNEKRIRLLI